MQYTHTVSHLVLCVSTGETFFGGILKSKGKRSAEAKGNHDTPLLLLIIYCKQRGLYKDKAIL